MVDVRIEGRIEGDHYTVTGPNVRKRIPLDEARADTKLAKAIERNGWQEIT